MDTAIAITTTQAWRVKLALTLLAETDRGLNAAGAPAAPQMPMPRPAPDVPAAVLDFPSLIAARLMSVARPAPSQQKNFKRIPKKKG